MIKVLNLLSGVTVVAEHFELTLVSVSVDEEFLKITYESDVPEMDLTISDIYQCHKEVKKIRTLTRQIDSGFRTAMIVEFEHVD